MSEHGLKTIPFGEYAATPGVSATTLDYIRKSPAHCRAFELGELRIESTSLTVGKVAHSAILEPDTFADEYAIQPDGMDFRTKAGKEWKEAQGNKPIVGKDIYETALRCRDSVHHNPAARALLSKGFSEQSLFVEDAGLTRKCRFDYVAMSGNTLPDVKTTRDASPDAFEKSVYTYGYHIRAAYYLDNAEMAGLGNRVFVLIAVETSAPYCTAVYQIPDEIIEFGRRIYKADLQRYRNCMETGKWPGYFDGIREIWLPQWAMKQMENL